MIPLKEIREINSRSNIVEYYIKNSEFKDAISDNIKQIGDLERLVSKISTLRLSPRECQKLRLSLESIIPIKKLDH